MLISCDADDPRSEGERLFAAYLRQRRLADYDFEPVVGNAQVDFVVDHPGFGPVSWEIYEPEWRLPNQPASRDPYEPIRRGFKRRKQVQAKAAATEGLPHVLVLHASRSDASFDPFIVAGAMFGNIGVTFTVDLEGGSLHTADVETVKAQIAAGTLFEWLSEEFPDGLWDWGRFTDEEKSELLDNFDALAQDLDETRELVVEHNGLALLLAYCLSRIQRLAGS